MKGGLSYFMLISTSLLWFVFQEPIEDFFTNFNQGHFFWNNVFCLNFGSCAAVGFWRLCARVSNELKARELNRLPHSSLHFME